MAYTEVDRITITATSQEMPVEEGTNWMLIAGIAGIGAIIGAGILLMPKEQKK